MLAIVAILAAAGIVATFALCRVSARVDREWDEAAQQALAELRGYRVVERGAGLPMHYVVKSN